MRKRNTIKLATVMLLMAGAIVMLTEFNVSAQNETTQKETFNLILKDAHTDKPLSGITMSVWYFNLIAVNPETNNNSYKFTEAVSDENGKLIFTGLEKLDASYTQILVFRQNYDEYPQCAIEPNISLFKKLLPFGRQYERDLNLDREKITSDKTYTVYLEPAEKNR